MALAITPPADLVLVEAYVRMARSLRTLSGSHCFLNARDTLSPVMPGLIKPSAKTWPKSRPVSQRSLLFLGLPSHWCTPVVRLCSLVALSTGAKQDRAAPKRFVAGTMEDRVAPNCDDAGDW